MQLYLGLVHHPINNKRQEIVTTSVTNLDIHDIARSCKTFGVQTYFIVTPLKAQHDLIDRILGHWKRDENGAYNPDRQNALSLAEHSESVDAALEKIEKETGKKPIFAVTGANFQQVSGTCDELKNMAQVDERPVFLLFGTGWGLHASIVERSDFMLEPLYGADPEGYNHLSVRSAVAIYLDRLMARQ